MNIVPDSAALEIIIDDDYIKKMGSAIQQWATALNGFMKDYKTKMQEITTDAITAGVTHDALLEFIEYLDISLLVETGRDTNGLALFYLERVDEADEYLY